jgi:hypothetical protein
MVQSCELSTKHTHSRVDKPRFPVSWEILTSLSLLVILLALLLTGSTYVKDSVRDRTRAYTRSIEFDYVDWILEAMWAKIQNASLGATRFIAPEDRRELVLEYLDLVRQSQSLEHQIRVIYSDPEIADPKSASSALTEELETITSRMDVLQPLAEEVLQSQVAEVVSELGLTLGGQPIPPVLFRGTPLPYALIVSPRDVIRQEADVSLIPGIDIEQITSLEDMVEESLNLSALVVPIGGVGVYPTMVQETTNLNWLSEVVSHEWTHNFLTLRPLGVNYLKSPELRTMNETTASIAGKEIGRVVLEKYYPELLPPPAPPVAIQEPSEPDAEPEEEEFRFDFVNEMRITRVNVDQLLAEGKIEEAEQYMEERRVIFWENGYLIRKLNQAYFAFYGAYADSPGGGAAGEDPVGAAVRQLRAESESLAHFLKRISWMSSFEQLQRALN